MLTYLLAVLSAWANATASVLQRKANRDLPQEDNLSWRLIRDLLHRPVWFAGILAVIAGFLLQAAALSTGQLATVQPVLALDLPATLLLASVVFRVRMHKREWGSAIAMSAGLALLLYSLSPTGGGAEQLAWQDWLLGFGGNLGLIACVVAAARWGRHGNDGSRRAALLGIGAGSAFGLTAALTKGVTAAFAHGFLSLFVTWQTYAMVGAGLLAMFLLQSAVNAGSLVAAQPGLTLVDPIVAILWGVLAFNEEVRAGWWILPEVLGGALMVGAVRVLARSPLLSDEHPFTQVPASPRRADDPPPGHAQGPGR